MDNLENIKKELTRVKDELEEKIKMLETTPDMGDDIDSLEEEASETEELGNQMSIAGEYRERLAEVNSALENIEKGTYGKCAKCGKDIENEVLSVAPESQLCREHKISG